MLTPHTSESTIHGRRLIALLIVITSALSLTGCPLRGFVGDEATDASAGDPDTLASNTRGADDVVGEPSPGCVAQPEGVVCNGLDDDCDGLTDEACTLRLGGHVLGAGYLSTSGDDLALAGIVGARHFIGTSSDGQWVIRGGLPPRGEAK